MARQLTDKQQKFLDVLFEEAGGSVTLAKKNLQVILKQVVPQILLED